MAKRRRKKPNIPQAALDHARQEVNEPDQPASSNEEEATPDQPTEVEAVSKSTIEEKPKPRRRRRSLQSAQLENRKNQGELDGEYVADMLANPTKIVTEEELKQDYGYVIQDLRNMGILAAVLFVALVGISLIVL